MKNFMKMVLLFGLLLGILNGCSKVENDPVNVVVLVGNRSNNAVPDYNAAYDMLYEACNTYGTVTIVTVEGEPVIVNQPFDLRRLGDVSEKKKTEIVSGWTEQIVEVMKSARASTEEADMLAAITMGVRCLRSYAESENLKMVILDSMISTAGEINFVTNAVEEMNVESINGIFPDLTGIEIFVSGAMDVALPQEDLSANAKKEIQNFWEELFGEANAKRVVFLDNPPSAVRFMDTELPSVSTVFVRSEVDSEETEISAEAEMFTEPEETLRLDETVFKFQPGKAELLYFDENALHRLAEQLIEAGMSVYIIGTTASFDEEDVLLKLSTARAEKIRDLLIAEGVPENLLVPLGLGYANEYTTPDEAAGPDSSEAAYNRSVWIVPIQ